MSPVDKIRAALQELADAGDSEGWSVSQFVIVMGLERISCDGGIEATAWYWAPADQADWMNGGLLEAAMDMRACADITDD